MTEEGGTDRAERRREAKKGQKSRSEPVKFPITFDHCPNPTCLSPRRFCVEGMKGDLQIEDILGKSPALFSFEYLYDTPTGSIKLIAVGDVCVDCGMPYIIAMEKLKGPDRPKLHVPPSYGRNG